MVRISASGRTYSDVSAIPYRRVGIVLGCSRILPCGRNNLFFQLRVAAAADLFKAHKVDYLLVSGDNQTKDYDEATDLKDCLVHSGVPPEKIYCDFAGFRTLDSVVRAKEVFGLTEMTIISQEFHNQRAIYLARHEGIDAIGFNAEEVDSHNSFGTKLREQLARVKTVLDVYLLRTRPAFLGPKIPIGEIPQPPNKK